MIALQKTSRYQRERNKFVKNSSSKTNALIKTLKIFVYNPNHPSLHLEKLGGSRLWTVRVDKSNRIFFFWVDSKTALLIDIGQHDKYRRY
ncbi:MAG: hypothetical protein A3B44_02035 [Candidatus Levybacteria bacterium RIFCSPLOWO2_01_FULL_38_21]|nr:MAG: hypothetical protein A3B44_02035 [Candidatus Levybacteria bacterium RIFCSPLOWO2_01_FULL_38_21]